MTLGRRSAGGKWNPAKLTASYDQIPNKEAPLWNPHSRVIYWWTSTQPSADEALMVAYDGNVWRRKTTTKADYFAFRAVREKDLATRLN
jgi:hypothetical protein